MRISAQEVKKCGRVAASYTIAAEAFQPYLGEGSTAGPGPVEVDAELMGSGVDVIGKFTAQANVQLTCARCLAAVPYHLRAEFWVTFRPRHAADPESIAMSGPLTADGEDIEVYSGDEIDLDGVVLQNLALAVPYKVVCSSECKGLEWRD
ncbi:MAG: YceD family protein [Bacillota bacterium]